MCHFTSPCYKTGSHVNSYRVVVAEAWFMNEAEEIDPREKDFSPRLAAIPTGSLRLDLALGAGGISCGQFVEISGSESSGKTTLCQHIVAEAQQMNRLCAWIDADHSFNPVYAARCGVALSELVFTGPPDAEQALDTLETLIRTEAGMIVVLDSVNGLTTREEFSLPLGITLPSRESDNEGEKLLSLVLRRLATVVDRSQAIVLFTNRSQLQRSEAYHQLSTHLTRLALKLHAGLRLELHKTGLISENRIIIGQQVQVKIVKNRNISSPLRVEFDIIYDQGINHSGEVFDLGLQSGFIHQQGENFSFRGLDLGIGRQPAIETLERQALIQPVEQAIRQKLLRELLSGER
jgi:recombination protein RecA